MSPRRNIELEIEVHMLAALEFAVKHPARWHDIGNDEIHKAAIARLEASGAVEVRDYSNQYKLIKA